MGNWKKSINSSEDIKAVFVGIPKEISDKILWVKDEYRTNSLSRQPGGTTVVVEFHQGNILGYDKIEYPDAYIEKFWEKENKISYPNYIHFNKVQKIEFYKERINRIFAKINDDGKAFKEVWNCKTANKLPWEVLKEFNVGFENRGAIKQKESNKILGKALLQKVEKNRVIDSNFKSNSDIKPRNIKLIRDGLSLEDLQKAQIIKAIEAGY